jgi:magnesium chelatase family protein
VNIAETARDAGMNRLFVPVANAKQACLISGIEVIGLKNLKEAFLYLKSELQIAPTVASRSDVSSSEAFGPFLDDIFGQEQAKRAAAIAVAIWAAVEPAAKAVTAV